MSVGYVFAGMICAILCTVFCVVMGATATAAVAVYLISGHVMVLGLMAASAVEMRIAARY